MVFDMWPKACADHSRPVWAEHCITISNSLLLLCSGLQLTDPSGELLPLFTSMPPHKEPPHHTAPADPHDSKSLEDLRDELARVNIDGESASPRSSTKKLLASESTAMVTETSHELPHSSSPQTGTKSVAPSDRNPPGIDLKTTKEGTTGGPLPQDALEQQQCGQTELSGKDLSDTKCRGTVKSHDTLTLDELKDCHTNPAGTIEIATTAPTPVDTQHQPGTAPQSTVEDENGRQRSRECSHLGDSGTTSGTKESQLLEPGSNNITYRDRQISRNPSLMSSSSIDSNDSTYESTEIDPIQASEQNPNECHPLISGDADIMAARKDRGKLRRQRCSQCKHSKEKITVLEGQLSEVEQTLISERKQNDKQVNDLKEQLFRTQQEAEQRHRQDMYNSDQRHQQMAGILVGLEQELQRMRQELERTKQAAKHEVQRTKQELRMEREEKQFLKKAYDLCLMKQELKRADSMQCEEYCDSHDTVYRDGQGANQMAHDHYHNVSGPRSVPHQPDIHNQTMTLYNSQWQTQYKPQPGQVYLPPDPHTL